MEEVDDNRGMYYQHGYQWLHTNQHTAPHSWKLVFECDSQLYEIMMTACSAAEESEWRKSMSQYQNSNDSGTYNPSVYSFLEFDIESLGPVFGKTGQLEIEHERPVRDILTHRRIHSQKNLYSNGDSRGQNTTVSCHTQRNEQYAR